MKIGGQILWNVTLVGETSQIYYLMGRHPTKDVLGNHLKDRLFRLIHWLSIILQLRRTSLESILTRKIRNSNIKNSRKKLKTPIALLLCLAKLLRKIVGVVHPTKLKQDLRALWKPVNLQDCVWENHFQIIMKTTLQEKVAISRTALQFGSQIYSYASSQKKFQQESQQWTRNGTNWRTFRRGTWQMSEVRKRSMKQGRRAQKFILCHWWTSVISRMPNWRQSTKNTKVELYSEAILWKTIQALVQYSPNKDHQHHKWQQQKSWIIISRLPGFDGQAADAVSAYTQVKMERCSQIIENPKSECPDIWIRLPRHKWPESWSSRRPSFVPLERNLYGHPCAGLLWKWQLEKILLQHGWEKVSNWECLFAHREKRLLLSVYVDDMKLVGKKQNVNPMWKLLNKEVGFGTPNGQWINLQGRLQNGPKPVTNAWIDWFHTFITHVNRNSIAMWVILQNKADWGLFQDSDFAGDLEDSKSTSEGTLCILGSHTFVPKSWMCQKQTSVSHSSTESEIMSLDVGLRFEGILFSIYGIWLFLSLEIQTSGRCHWQESKIWRDDQRTE